MDHVPSQASVVVLKVIAFPDNYHNGQCGICSIAQEVNFDKYLKLQREKDVIK
jgi:hypothetical protein